MQMEQWSVKKKNNTKDVFTLYLFNKNKTIMKRTLSIDGIIQNIKTICKCKLVVFEIEGKSKKELLSMLSDVGKIKKYYGLIAEVGEGKLFYFPQLNYSDVYLIKDILVDKYVNTNVSMILGENII